MQTRIVAASAAILVVLALLVPSSSMLAEEQKIPNLDEIATVTVASPNIRSIADYLSLRRRVMPVTLTCDDFIVSAPFGAPSMEFVSGCQVPVGTLVTINTQYGDGSTAQETRRIDVAIPAGLGFKWTPDATISDAGIVTLTVVLPNLTAWQMKGAFGSPVSAQEADEEIVRTQSNNPGRTITIRDINCDGLTAFLNHGSTRIDLATVPSSCLGGIATYDVSNANIPQGFSYLLTISQSGNNQTVALFHPDCMNGACSLPVSQPVPPPTPPPTSAPTTLAITQNPSLGNQSLSAGTTSQRVGSFVVSSSSSDTSAISNISIQVSCSNDFENLILRINGAQYGATQAVVSAGIYTFSGVAPRVQAGGSLTLDVYADILSSASGSCSPATTIEAITATDSTTGSLVSSPIGVQGQGLAIIQGGPTLSITLDPTSPTGDAVMGSTGNTLAVFRVTNLSNSENAKLTSLSIGDLASASQPSFINVQISVNGTVIGPNINLNAGDAVQLNSTIIPAGNAITLTFTGDVPSYISGIPDDTMHAIRILAATGVGMSSNEALTVSSALPVSGNPIRVLRTDIILSTAPIGVNGQVKSVSDILGSFTVQANPAGSVVLQGLAITFSGSGLTPSFLSAANITLLDANGNDVLATLPGSGTMVVANGVATWSFPSGSGYVIPAGTPYTFRIRVNSTALASGTPNVSESLIASIQSLLYADGSDPSAIGGLTLFPSVFPLVIASVEYPVGE